MRKNEITYKRCVQRNDWFYIVTVIYPCLKPFNYVRKMRSGSFKNVIKKLFSNNIYSIYMYKDDLVLNNLQWLIYHKTQPTILDNYNI